MLFRTPPRNFDHTVHVSGMICHGNNGNELLLLRRAPGKPYPLTWCVPGGKTNPRETPLDTAVRELCEETGLEIPSSMGTRLETLYFQNEGHPDITYHVYRCSFEGIPKVSIQKNEHVSFSWLSPHEALQLNLIPGERGCLRLAYSLQPEASDYSEACDGTLNENQLRLIRLSDDRAYESTQNFLKEVGIEDPLRFLYQRCVTL